MPLFYTVGYRAGQKKKNIYIYIYIRLKLSKSKQEYVRFFTKTRDH